MPTVPDAIVLCGGAGLRLRSITAGAPKATADIAGRPFLELLLRQLRRYKFQRVILAVGFQRDVIRSQFGKSACGLRLHYSSEETPLGTGGALQNAYKLIQSDTCLVMNGDSYTNCDLNRLMTQHVETKADVSVVVVLPDQREDVGWVSADEKGRMLSFDEKRIPNGARYFSAGIYSMTRSVLGSLPVGIPMSLETQLLPTWLAEGKNIMAFVSSSQCIDIGTPERYKTAQRLLADAEVTTNPSEHAR